MIVMRLKNINVSLVNHNGELMFIDVVSSESMI